MPYDQLVIYTSRRTYRALFIMQSRRRRVRAHAARICEKYSPAIGKLRREATETVQRTRYLCRARQTCVGTRCHRPEAHSFLSRYNRGRAMGVKLKSGFEENSDRKQNFKAFRVTCLVSLGQRKLRNKENYLKERQERTAARKHKCWQHRRNVRNRQKRENIRRLAKNNTNGSNSTRSMFGARH